MLSSVAMIVTVLEPGGPIALLVCPTGILSVVPVCVKSPATVFGPAVAATVITSSEPVTGDGTVAVTVADAPSAIDIGLGASVISSCDSVVQNRQRGGL